MKHLLILCGGQSAEHEISVRSAKNILEALNKNKYQITIMGITKFGHWRWLEKNHLHNDISNSVGVPITIHPGYSCPFQTKTNKIPPIDVIFPVLHGPNGEDGTIQGLCKLLKISYVGSSTLSSAVAMDKDLTKRLLTLTGINVAPWIVINKENIPSYLDVANELGKTMFVKPANMGSSVGIHKITNAEEWNEAIQDALSYDKKVLVEQAIEGKELECGVIGMPNAPKVTGVGEIVTDTFYSYNEKYSQNSQTIIEIPAKINPKYLKDLKNTALKVYQTLECEVLARVDMFLTPSGKIYVNEINTLPGFTSISMFPKLWQNEGITYSQLLDEIIDLSIKKGV